MYMKVLAGGLKVKEALEIKSQGTWNLPWALHLTTLVFWFPLS